MKPLDLAVLVAMSVQANAQVYTQNIVGYINQVLYPGDNLIANQLAYSNNTLNAIFQPGVPEGATFTEWNPTAQQYLPNSVYDTNSGWSINYELGYGQGGLFYTPVAFTNTFVGDVWPGVNLTNNGLPFFIPPLVTGGGSLLLACYVPIAPATFYDVVGRDPQDSESVTYLNAFSQVSTTTTFQNGAWDNGAPGLDVGQAAFFNLDAEPVPEPAIGELAGVGLMLLAFCKMRRRPAD